MNNSNSKILVHWINRANVTLLETHLSQNDLSVENPQVARLADRDQMHAGTLDATKKFADWVGMGNVSTCLDLGSGLGGTARFLASENRVNVTAIELCSRLDLAARELTRRCNLDPVVEHLCGDITQSPPLPENSRFDLIWIQHVDMQVQDKAELYGAAAAHLAPGGGRVVWHDWLDGPGGKPHWPLFWSSDGEISFCVDRERFEELLAGAGLEISRLEPIGEQTIQWFEKSRANLTRALGKMESASSPNRDRIAWMNQLAQEMDNAIANVRENRLIPFFGEARAL